MNGGIRNKNIPKTNLTPSGCTPGRFARTFALALFEMRRFFLRITKRCWNFIPLVIYACHVTTPWSNTTFRWALYIMNNKVNVKNLKNQLGGLPIKEIERYFYLSPFPCFPTRTTRCIEACFTWYRFIFLRTFILLHSPRVVFNWCALYHTCLITISTCFGTLYYKDRFRTGIDSVNKLT